MNLLANYIDLTNLSVTATPQDIVKLCDIAMEYNYKSVCVSGSLVVIAEECLRGSNVDICTVIGFPSGMSCSAAKLAEAKLAVADGADELDMVMNIGRFKAKEYEYIINEVNSIAGLNKTLKVIIETALLTDQEIAECCELLMQTRAQFVKTSTGFSTRGASSNDVSIMRKCVGNNMAVKAAGGIRSVEAAAELLAIGADRIGSSANLAAMVAECSQDIQCKVDKACEIVAKRISNLKNI